MATETAAPAEAEATPDAKRALITGITGQDGSYLAELLLEKGYEVHGIIRRSSSFNTGRIEHLYRDRHEKGVKLFLHYGDLTDASNLTAIMVKVKPFEVYNLAAQSHVKVSFEMAQYTADVDGLGTLRLLDAIRTAGLAETVRFYQASTSELYGKVQAIPQDEKTPFYPRSPYAVAKQFAYWTVINYREAYGIHASNGILFNHESPRRGPTFVTRKITRAVAAIKTGNQECVWLGNLSAKRDWGHARDYVVAMWLMMQQEEADDYVISTNESHSVRHFCEAAFGVIGVTLEWAGEGVAEVGKDKATGVVRVRVDPRYFRPTEVELLIGDCAKAERVLGWKRKVDFKGLVKEMVNSDLEEYLEDSTAVFGSGAPPKRGLRKRHVSGFKQDPKMSFSAEARSPKRSPKTSPKLSPKPEGGEPPAKRIKISDALDDKALPPDGPEHNNSF